MLGEAADGSAAIERAVTHQPDVVLLDLKMPLGNGLDALPRIISASPGSRVVLLSGYPAKDVVAEAMAGGAAGFLSKGSGNVVDDLLAILGTPASAGR